jgi:hypothetical protein
MGLQLSRWSSRRFGVLLLEQLYGNANVGKPAPDPLGHAHISELCVTVWVASMGGSDLQIGSKDA